MNVRNMVSRNDDEPMVGNVVCLHMVRVLVMDDMLKSYHYVLVKLGELNSEKLGMK